MVSVEVLRSLPIFTGLPTQTLKAIAAIAEERDFVTGQVLWRQGDVAQSMYIVRQGQVDIIYELQGGKSCVVDTVVGGELTGWSAVVEPYRFTAASVAREAGRAVCIEAAGLRRLCDQDPLLGYRLMTHVARTLTSRLEGARLQLVVSS